MSAQEATATIWDRERLWITLGATALIFLAALESLAVTTVMPIVAADLDGADLYAVAFAGTLATGVIGMVAVGAWADRAGPRAPLYAAVVLFFIGLLVAGFATTMPTFLAGRLIQGLGAGGQTVALYVVVARIYPAWLHGRVFAIFAAAWVVPSMIGPFLAGAVAEFLHWRWAFLGVSVLVAVAFVLVMYRLKDFELGPLETDTAKTPGVSIGVRLILAIIIATAAVGVGLTVDLPDGLGWPAAALAIIVIAITIRPLLPKGALRARAGLPSVVLMRAIVAGAFFSAEVYIPYLLMQHFDFSPTWAGVALTLAALAWAAGSAMQGRYGERLGPVRLSAISLMLVFIGLASVLFVALSMSAPWVVVVGWGIAGGGMGLLYPRLTVLTLAYSKPGSEGFNSSALSIADSTGSAVAIAIAGLAFGTLAWGISSFAVVFLFSICLVLLATIPGFRLGGIPRAEQPS